MRRSRPGMLTFSGSGSNSSNHLAQAASTSWPASRRPTSRSAAPARDHRLLGKQTVAGFNYATVGHQLMPARCACSPWPPRSGMPALPGRAHLQGAGLRSGRRRLSRPGGAEVHARGDCGRRCPTSSATSTPIRPSAKKMEDDGFVLTDIGYDKMPAFMAEKKKEYDGAGRQARHQEEVTVARRGDATPRLPHRCADAVQPAAGGRRGRAGDDHRRASRACPRPWRWRC